MKHRLLIIVFTLCLGFSFFCFGCGAIYSADPMPLLPYGVLGNFSTDTEMYGDRMLFLDIRGSTVFELPSVTWSARKDASVNGEYDIYYDFVFSGWLPFNGSYNDITIALLLPKYCVGSTSVDTQFSPQGLVATFSYDTGMFALSNDGVALNLYHFSSVTRSGSKSFDPVLPLGDFWYSAFYFDVAGISSPSDQLLLTVRIHIGDYDDSLVYEGDTGIEYGTPSFSDLFGGLGEFLSVFWVAFNNRALLTILIPVSECIVLGILLKLIL